MNIRFTHHAQIGMMERGITAQRVADAIRHPYSRFPARDGLTACIKHFGGKTLKVVFREQKGEYVIITMYYL